jgi:hypothetical protein
LVGKFNLHLYTICFIFADEALFAGDKANADALKGLITDPDMFVEPKGVNGFLARNYLNIMMGTNNDWAVPAGPNARRYAVFRGNPRYAKGFCDEAERREYFGAILREMEEGGVAAMMWDLMQRSIEDWKPEAFPVTKALVQQKRKTLRGYDQLFESCCQTGTLPRDDRWRGRPDCATVAAILRAVQRLRGCEFYLDSSVKEYFRENFPDLPFDFGWRVGGTGKGWSGIAFPSLPDCREALTKRFGGSWTWDEEISRWTEEQEI